jgi:hypothetical protein
MKVAAGASVPGLGSVNNRIVGPVVVPWQGGVTYRFNWQATDRRKVGDLARIEGAKVILVGYSALGENDSFIRAMERARKAAESLSEVLAKTGVSRQQQELVIVGPSVVVSDPTRQGDRVEVMVVTQ